MSKYTDIEFLDAAKNILLVKDNETSEIYVKKYISDRQRKIYAHIRNRGYEGVPKVIDIYPEQDYFVLIEEYIDGQSLQQMLDKGITFPRKYMLTFARFFVKTLSPIHDDGLIHRDIKPANIICRGDELYLIDFGISRFYNKNQGTDTELLGTRDYAAPEQFGFGQSTSRTDIYAIGMVMLAMLFGDSESSATNDDDIVKTFILNSGFLRIIERCTETDPEKRYPSVKSLFWAVFRAVYWPFFSKPFFVIYALILAFIAIHL